MSLIKREENATRGGGHAPKKFDETRGSGKLIIEPLTDWELLKQEGSGHYKTGKVEPIDLYKSITPHSSLNAMEVKALTDNIKYSYRMLSRGITVSDLDKVIHYSRLAKCSFQERDL